MPHLLLVVDPLAPPVNPASFLLGAPLICTLNFELDLPNRVTRPSRSGHFSPLSLPWLHV